MVLSLSKLYLLLKLLFVLVVVVGSRSLTFFVGGAIGNVGEANLCLWFYGALLW